MSPADASFKHLISFSELSAKAAAGTGSQFRDSVKFALKQVQIISERCKILWMTLA
jgi:hypothetical protein